MDAASFIEPECTELAIYDLDFYTYDPCGIEAPRNLEGWRALGNRIGEHEHLLKLGFGQFNATAESLEALLRGISQNRSVRKLAFSQCRGDWPLEILAPFYKNLHSLRVYECNLSREAIHSLSTALRGCTACSLERIGLFNSTMDDEYAVEFIESLAGLSRLKGLTLADRNIGLRSCNAMAALLRNPVCTLKDVRLSLNSIGDEGLDTLTSALGGNRTLTQLDLCVIGHTTSEAWSSFAGILSTPTCMLERLGLWGNAIDNYVIAALADALHRNIRLKCLHLGNTIISGINWAQIFGGGEMNRNISPHVLAWLGGNDGCTEENNCTAVYRFLRTMPALCGNSCRVVRRSTRKRKAQS